MALPFKIFILSLSAIILLKVVSASNDHDIDQIFRGSRGKRDDIGQIFYQSRGKRFITGPMIRLKLKNYRTPSSLDYIGNYWLYCNQYLQKIWYDLPWENST